MPEAAEAYHPRTARRRRQGGKLGLLDATAMGVGGMIGGGIFSVLGVAITLAGHLAFGCFVIGGLVAAVTARSYGTLTVRTGRSGGPFEYLREAGHPHLAGLLVWLLVFGYVVAMGIYSFTFGRYAANGLGASVGVGRVLSVGIVGAFLVVNLGGLRISTSTEDLIVIAKIVILLVIAGVGIAEFGPDRLTPLTDHGLDGLVFGAATVFFAYEGFELISYDHDDTRDPIHTVPRALMLSVVVVAVVSVVVTLGSQMLVPDHVLVHEKEAAFVAVGRAAFGDAGRWAAILGALLATGSAINATLFSTSRLMHDASRSGHLPAFFARRRHDIPVEALAFISVAGLCLALLPGITTVIAFGSASFLAVYVLVNLIEVRTATRRRERLLGLVGATACVLAVVALVVSLARDDPTSLLVLVGCAVVLGGSYAIRNRGRGPGTSPSPAPRSA